MTVPVPLDAFDDADIVVRKRARRFDPNKLIGMGITAALHVLLLVGALSIAHVQGVNPPQVLTVQITPAREQELPPPAVAPLPRLVQPAVITVPLPEILVRNALSPPIAAQVARSPSLPPAPPAPPSQAATEGRDSYFGRLLAHLNRYKRYPQTARATRSTGVVMLQFVMDAQGQVLSFEIAKSSGRRDLDEEALALIQRAVPLPSLPSDFPTRTLNAVVPVSFTLNR